MVLWPHWYSVVQRMHMVVDVLVGTWMCVVVLLWVCGHPFMVLDMPLERECCRILCKRNGLLERAYVHCVS
jgi:hypothetical protein